MPEMPPVQTEGTSEPLISPRWARVLYAGTAVAAVAALVVNITRPFGWRVDATSVGLIGLLLLIPLAEHLRKLKVGGLEAEFAERVTRDIGNLEKRVKDIGDTASDPGRTDEAPAETELATAPLPVGHSIRRIVWVDDRPEDNRLEMAELEQRFEIVPSTSTEAAMDEISSNPKGTAVISDAVRVEGGRENVNAGSDLISRVHKAHAGIPVYIYCGPETVRSHGAELQQAGARLVTDSFTELARVIRSDSRRRFYGEVESILQAAGDVEPGSAGLDYVVQIPSRRIGVIAKNYRRSATAHHAQALDDAVARLDNLVREGEIAAGVIVTPRDVFAPAQRQQAPERVQLLLIDQLPGALLDFGSL